MELFFFSFFAGVLTVLAPCVFPLLPIIIGGSLAKKSSFQRPLIITLSLAVSIVLFTLLLKFSTALIGVSPQFWKLFSGGIVVLFGLSFLFPKIWGTIMSKIGADHFSHTHMHRAGEKEGKLGMIMMGASLGPVFTSCSPTYGLILATVLPQNIGLGMVYLFAYALGLACVLFLVALGGQKMIKKLRWAVNPNGVFRKILGLIFLLVGLAIITGIDKAFEAWVLDQGFFDVTQIEEALKS